MSVVRRQADHDERVHRRPRHRHGPPERGHRRAAPATPGTVEAVAATGEPRPRPAVAVVERVERGRRRRAPSRRPGSSSPVAAASAARRASGSSRSSPRRSAARSGRPAPRSTPAGSRTASRSARPARSSSRSSISRSGSAARSSTRSGCRPPADDRRGQPRPRRADRRVRRPVRRRRPVRGRSRRSSTQLRARRAEPAAAGTAMRAGSILLPLVAFVALAAGLAVVFRRDRPDRRPDPRGRAASASSVQRPRRAGRRVARAARPAGSTPSAASSSARTRSAETHRWPRRTPSSATSTRPGRCTGRRRPQAIRDDLVAELERAGRALAMVEHGATILVDVAAAQPRARGADVDQARLPEPHPRPGGDRPPRRARRGPADGRAGPGADAFGALTPRLTTPCSGILGLHHKTLWWRADRRAMRCPQCGERETRVVDSRDLDDSATIRRRRECAACTMRFTTYERVEAARLVVVKRDGTRQEFDRDKLVVRPAQGADPPARSPTAPPRPPPTRSRRSCARRASPRSRRRAIGALAMEQLRGDRPDRLHPVRQRLPELRGPRGAQARGRHALRRAGQRGADAK